MKNWLLFVLRPEFAMLKMPVLLWESLGLN